MDKSSDYSDDKIESNLSLKEEEENSYSNKSSKNDNNELKEVGDYIGDRQIKKDPDEMKHLNEVCAAFFNYKVLNYL